MNHTSIKRISLTTLALVAALAVSARANGPVTSAAEHRSPVNPNHSMARVLLPDEVYQIDDGVSENSVGLTIGGDIIAFIRFNVIPGSETITSINCAFGTPLFPDPTLNGLAYTAALWDDPNGDTNPSDATLLATKDGVISQAGTDTFLLNAITPTTITTPDFFVGYVVRGTVAGQFPCGLDQTNPKNNQNWVAGGASGDIQNLENNDLPPLLLEDAGLPGNWLIRADAGAGGENIVLGASVRRQQGGNRVVALTWSPADGGPSVNVLRNGVVFRPMTADDGTVQDNIGHRSGTFTYQVCEPDSGTCSNVVTVRVR